MRYTGLKFANSLFIGKHIWLGKNNHHNGLQGPDSEAYARPDSRDFNRMGGGIRKIITCAHSRNPRCQRPHCSRVGFLPYQKTNKAENKSAGTFPKRIQPWVI